MHLTWVLSAFTFVLNCMAGTWVLSLFCNDCYACGFQVVCSLETFGTMHLAWVLFEIHCDFLGSACR